MNKTKLWQEVLESIKVSVSPAIFSTWFSQTHLSKLTKVNKKRQVVEIGCSSPYVKTTIEQRYFGLLQDALNQILETKSDLIFVVKQLPGDKEASPANAPLFSSSPSKPVIERFLDKAHILPGFTFQNFAVSSSNQMAWAAAEAVAQKPGEAYNPLFLWGGVGVGKTHLMNAVGYWLLEKEVTDKVLMVTGEQFTNDIVEGIRNKTTQAFRNKYRKLKALLIDDIQFIAGKDAVQDEFFHTFNAVTSAGGQIILTSDQPPSEISRLEERLRSRFEAGLIVDIAPPDFELRCAIIQIKTKQNNLEVPSELVHLVAGNIDSARKIQGFLTRLISEVKIKQVELSEELIKSLLGRGVMENGPKKKMIKPEEVVEAVAKYYSLAKRALMGKTRARAIARPRQILMYLLRVDLGISLQEVGHIVGGRDHTTVIHAVTKITEMASTDVQIREDLLGIRNSF